MVLLQIWGFSRKILELEVANTGTWNTRFGIWSVENNTKICKNRLKKHLSLDLDPPVRGLADHNSNQPQAREPSQQLWSLHCTLILVAGGHQQSSSVPWDAGRGRNYTKLGPYRLSGIVVNAVDFGTGGWWFELKSSRDIQRVLDGKRHLWQAVIHTIKIPHI